METSNIEDPGPRQHFSSVLVVFLLLLVLGGLFVAFAPVKACPGCNGNSRAIQFQDGSIKEMSRVETAGNYIVGKDLEGRVVRVQISSVTRFLPCLRCKRSGKISILRWLCWKADPE